MPPLPAPAVPPELPATGALVVGFSGGLDSTVLLHWLAADPALRARGLRALHVNHALHPAADAWQRHCVAVCERLQVPLRSVRVEVQRGAGSGLEAAAREARHAAFAAELAAGEVLVLAHHRADQAETFLLRALRASGPDGLAAMRPWRRYGAGWLWRPLLGCGRDALLAHARAHGLGWIDDPGNADPAFDRNFLRARVLPLLRERWPHADAALARAAALCGEAQALLEDGDAEALALAASADPHCLRVGPLRALPAP
ncbi:tRNA lysidine(34) synthetase TilS, partial [Vulcaniibacterium tengchongense]